MMTIDGLPVRPFAAIESAVKITVTLGECGMPMREMIKMLDEEWESAYVSLCAADPIYRMYDYL